MATVAVPVGIAYAELAGFPPQVGLYSSLLPLIAYAIFGSSRQLIVGPDAATCAVIAAAITLSLAGIWEPTLSLSAMLALLTGLICIAASFLRLGALADFLEAHPGWLPQRGGAVDHSRASGQDLRLHRVRDRLSSAHSRDRLEARRDPRPHVRRCRWHICRDGNRGRLAPTLPSALVGMALAGAAVPLFGLADAGVKQSGQSRGGCQRSLFPRSTRRTFRRCWRRQPVSRW